MDLFARHGLDGPSLDDICAHAGFTRGAFYVHFKDRDDFLVAVMDTVGRAIIDELLAVGPPGEAGLAAAMQRFVTACTSGRYPLMPPGGIRPHQLLEACARSPELRKHYVTLVATSEARVKDLFETARGQGLLRTDVDPACAAKLVMALIVGIQTLADLGVTFSLAELGREVMSLLAPAPAV